MRSSNKVCAGRIWTVAVAFAPPDRFRPSDGRICRLVYVKLARRIDGDMEEVVLYEEWKDTASLYGWTGPEVTKPRMMPGAEDLVSDLDIKHYEALDIDPTTFEEI